MNNSYKISRAENSELSEIKGLLNKNKLPVEDLHPEKQDFWLMQDSYSVIGAAGLEPYGKYAIFRSFVVEEQFRNKGFGNEIYSYTIEQAKKAGFEKLFLLTETAGNYFLSKGWIVINRESVPDEIKLSREFNSICPSSAVCMYYPLTDLLVKEALDKFTSGLNCAQSVFSTFAKRNNMDEQQSLRISTGFGAGISYKAAVCGAVTGAYMTIGLINGSSKGDQNQQKEKVNDLIKRFDNEFIKYNGSVLCKDLLKADISKQEELDKLRKENAFRKICPMYIKDAVEILQKLL